MNDLVAIVGPTAIGKSRLALKLAQVFDGEIVGADSRQVYRHLDIGTAKPGREDMARVCHHLIDIINPDEPFNLAQYQELAAAAIDGITRRQRLPLLVGGSGQYIWALLEGWGIPRVAPNPGLRQDLEERAAANGGDELFRELWKADPAAAGRIDPRNVRRVIRALEVSQDPQASADRQRQKHEPTFRSLIIGLTIDRDQLYQRIDARVDAMLERGLVAEVEKLLGMGYSSSLPALSGIGYKQIGQYLAGNITLETAMQQMKFESHRFVRQQYNWFNLKDDRIKWFDVRQPRAGEEIAALIAEFSGRRLE